MPRIVPYGFLSVPPWIVPLLPCNDDLAAFKRASTLPVIYHQRYQALLRHYPDYVAIYTDGSKSPDAVGYSFVAGSSTCCGRLPSEFSVFMAELYAIGKAIRHTLHAPKHTFVIFTDSLSAMQALSAFDPRNPRVKEI